MTTTIEDELRAKIQHAFGKVSAPPPEDLLQGVYAGNDDAFEMRQAFEGKHWSDIPIKVLSHHRESVIMLSGLGYRAYLAAYLNACLANDTTFGPDVRGYTLYGLRPLSKSEVHVATAHERLSLLDHDQREVVSEVLRYLESSWRMKEAGDVLRGWESKT
jgi:hypothetical protein